MSSDLPSIEDLIEASRGKIGEGSAFAQFSNKQQEIKTKELERLTQQRASKLGFPYIFLYGFPISSEALLLIEEEVCKQLQVVCFYYDGKRFRIAAINPQDPAVEEKMRQLEDKFKARGTLYLTSEYSINYALQLYKRIPRIKKSGDGVKISAEDFERFKQEISDYRSLNEKINEVNISEVITLLLAASVKTGATDIHIEAEEGGIVVRLRIDGILHEAAQIDKNRWSKIISRMKLLAGVKINIEDKPQDGRFTILLPNDKIDVRVSFLPTAYGESVVMRLLRSSSVGLSFEQLGLLPQAYKILEREIKKPNGLILSTGPTGSGKTTTLYAILNKLNNPETKIITLEDPIEYKLKGVNQSQVDADKDYTFAKGLRSILRQDPDIVMVGEMRDLETAEIAIQASLTGHLVLSTLHTNDAAGVIPRLLEMGIKPFLIVPSINAVIGQRLVRKLCEHCKVEHQLNAEEEEIVKKILAIISPKAGVELPAELPTFYKAGKGCVHCSGIGYKGRIGIYEIFTMNEDIKKLTMERASAYRILEKAIENGMITMLQDGVLKCMQGIVSLDEVFRVIGKFDYVENLYSSIVSRVIGTGLNIEKEVERWGEKWAADFSIAQKEVKDIDVDKLIFIILATAIKSGASDIHFDPTENGVKVRFRIDGIMREVISILSDEYLHILSKLKLMAGFPSNVKRTVYEGRFGIKFASDGDKVDCRVSIVSGGYGETAVIRLLTVSVDEMGLENIGMRGKVLEIVRKSSQKLRGLILTAGPTGSGKTTTLYSIMKEINIPQIKIITVEDPIEYHMGGVMQTQINPEKGFTFSVALRSFMRQNPNVIMVGEVRDRETADTAIEAAITGHLVMSTIHANNAASAILRLIGLGVNINTLGSALECVVGQRLVRKNCPHCLVEEKLETAIKHEVDRLLAEIAKAGIKLPSEIKFYKSQGCDKCGHFGYKGRMGIFEVIKMSSLLRETILDSKLSENLLEQQMLKQGYLLIIHDGLLKALAKEVSVAEVFRVAK
ncbi:type II/IV secretion system protein [Candidatus Parcubacteria bacterium]|nr:MAG: type II/IV secretion system protein [Candidatus Parcubacteria bacterium]